ncbi:MAG TPA: hypothetical protein VIR58_15390 [Acidimicrobiales bacterium]
MTGALLAQSSATTADQPIQWSVVLGALAFGALGVWIGVRTWQGRVPGPEGPRPPYQSYFGGAHAAAPVGAGFAGIGVAELVRGLLSEDRDGTVFTAVSVVAFVVLAAGGLYSLCYYWLGVPPRLRPPYQRDQQAPGPRRGSRLSRLKDHR